MFDAYDRYKQKQNKNNQFYESKRTGEKHKRLHISLSPKTQRQIEDFRVKHDLTGNDQYVIENIIEFVAAFNEIADMRKKDPSFIFALKKQTNKRKYIDFIYDNCDREEAEVIRDAAQDVLDIFDRNELRRRK